ncbi:hypothetical protein QAD02_020779 [Eretmocerus hayati]|uniref:Uncharacterized protein n=1 Tax=Eretmocerus hayati TaxID=131215 RepID=A0ACC2PQ94_9HYME|nr:hypothetical protein QAD02_020779 [Eretmocerus hayati]
MVETIDLTSTKVSELAEGAFRLPRTEVPQSSTKSRSIVHKSISDLTALAVSNEKLRTGIENSHMPEKKHETKTHKHSDISHSEGNPSGFEIPRIRQVPIQTVKIVDSNQKVVSRQKREAEDGYIHISPLRSTPILKSSYCGPAVNGEKLSLNFKSVPESIMITDIQSLNTSCR